MKAVITGSTKGIGLALAREFLQYGDDLVVSSRSGARVESTVTGLQHEFPACGVFGIRCDVTRSEEVDALSVFALERLGDIDIWINNAGVTGYQHTQLVETSDNLIQSVVQTNLVGSLYGCRAALRIMLDQGKGHIFNMDGYGADGRATPGLAAYGATKRAIPQLTETLVKETQGSQVGVHILSPGMVLTDLLLENAPPESKRVFNILAERPETVAEFLVPRIRTVTGSGRYIRYLTQPKILWRFATAWRRKGRFFDSQGRAVEKDGTGSPEP